MSKLVLINEAAPPSPPSVGSVALYPQGNVLFSIDSNGIITQLSGGGVLINTAAPMTGGGAGTVFNLGVSVGTGAGTVAAGNDSRIVNAVPNTRTLAGAEPIAINGLNSPQALTGNLNFAFKFTGETWGAVAFRGALGWEILPPGTAGQLLRTSGLNANPTWTSSGGGNVTINTAAPLTGGGIGALFNLAITPGTAGGLFRYSGGAWGNLPVGSNGDALTVVAGTPTWTPAVPTSRSISTTGGIVGGGDFSTNRTHQIGFGTQPDGSIIARIAGAWTTLVPGSNTQVLTLVAGVPAWATPTGGSSSFSYVPLSGRYVTDSTQPAATTEPAGGNTWHPAEHNFTGARTIRLRAVFGSVLTPTAVQIALFSIFDMAYVTNLDGGGNPYIQTTLVSGTIAAMAPLLSRDLRATPLSNFDETVDGRLYEVHVRSMVGGVAALLHVAELVVGLP